MVKVLPVLYWQSVPERAPTDDNRPGSAARSL
jgi:hypothetical protein